MGPAIKSICDAFLDDLIDALKKRTAELHLDDDEALLAELEKMRKHQEVNDAT